MRVFNELQRFDHWWLRLGIAVVLLAVGYACYRWYILEKWVGNIGPNDTVSQFVIFTIVPFLCLGIQHITLKSQIDETGVRYQFSPFQWSYKSIPWEAIANVEVRSYRPLKEYGGWGYRLSFGNGNALSIKGNKGIQLQLKNGKKVLIGTQKSKHAQEVLDRYFQPKKTL